MKTKPTEALKIIVENWGKGGTAHDLKIGDTIACNVAFKEGQSSPKIKQLEWERLNTTYYVDQYNPIGYRAKISEWDINNKKFILSLGLNDFSDAKIFDTLEEAKQFAQTDFEKRLMECLITE